MTDKDPAREAASIIDGTTFSGTPEENRERVADIIRSAFAEALEDRRRLDALLDPEGPLCVLHRKRASPPLRTRDEIDEVLGEEPDDER